MGDRISIQYKNGTEKSVILFSHWQGMTLKKLADEHYKTVVRPLHDQNGLSMPLTRMEPHTVMVDFIRYLCRDNPFKVIDGDLYLVASEDDGDNSDNGHWVLDLITGKWTHHGGY
jgi:hypothetical protein